MFRHAIISDVRLFTHRPKNSVSDIIPAPGQTVPTLVDSIEDQMLKKIHHNINSVFSHK
jgi:hypothetical protein